MKLISSIFLFSALLGISASAQTVPSDNIDSLGCGDGVKSTPNVWFVSISRNDPNMFQATALLSVNLFRITNVSGDTSFVNGTVGIVDASKIQSINYLVTFQPGNDSIGYPTAHADSIKNRDSVLTELKNLGASVNCNQILPSHFPHPVSRKGESI